MTAIREPWGLSVLGAGSVAAEPRFAEIDLAVDVLAATPKESYAEAGRVAVRFEAAVLFGFALLP
ncbi:hypothetical protein ABZ667_19815 [Streptomyces lavendulae]|uniref:hypothetical protein n=1 Tax=Streptomyces lavendulae TaxID=1914 RepID=UPI0033FC7E14